MHVGWNDTAFEIEKLIKCPNLLLNAEPFRVNKEDYPYMRAVRATGSLIPLNSQ